MLLEDNERSNQAVGVHEPHFAVRSEFRNASYARRYELLCPKVERERVYDGTCFLMSSREGGLEGKFREPKPELSFRNFAVGLRARIAAQAQAKADAGGMNEPSQSGPSAGEIANG